MGRLDQVMKFVRNLFSAEGILLWSPLYDAIGDQGGLYIYSGSHKHGIYPHEENSPKTSHQGVSPEILNQFERRRLAVKAGTLLLIDCAVIHESVETVKKDFARFILSERFCPLRKIPYLRQENVPVKIPYPDGVKGFTKDYNELKE